MKSKKYEVVHCGVTQLNLTMISLIHSVIILTKISISYEWKQLCVQPNKLTEISQTIILTIKEWQRKRTGKPHRKPQIKNNKISWKMSQHIISIPKIMHALTFSQKFWAKLCFLKNLGQTASFQISWTQLKLFIP